MATVADEAELVPRPLVSLGSALAARHVCQEARFVLTSLRGGPPTVARGELSQDLVDLRDALQQRDQTTTPPPSSTDPSAITSDASPNSGSAVTGWMVARPFLQVVTDPRAAGPHTLVALRAMGRLLQQGSFEHYNVPLEDLTQAVLSCRFEQTDPGADEAVEMAIADVLQLLVTDFATSLLPGTLMEAFNTVFVTRNTFVHSPALCYHFEDVLTAMVRTVFSSRTESSLSDVSVLEFIVNQLLHTPLVGGEGALDEASREAQRAHDANRILCLRLTRTALEYGWAQTEPAANSNEETKEKVDEEVQPEQQQERSLLQIIQDDLCLSLLMTGQAIWAYHDANSDISPGYVSLEVLVEICATLSTLWNTLPLRAHLVAQFETIFTGFYTRALVLLRKRKEPLHSVAYNANLIFDAEVEVILESLVDILCLHDHRQSIVDGDGGFLETVFASYDCHMRRSDVALGLVVELCRACGGTITEEGHAILKATSSNYGSHDEASQSSHHTSADDKAVSAPAVRVEHPWRQVPPHLKELCAQAIMGGMKCLFRDDKASAETMWQRSHRKRSILVKHAGDLADESDNASHYLRDLKSRKHLMCKAARIFNGKASKGLQFLADSGLLPDPVTPDSVASFLRNGIVVGLDKRAVGAYLGEAGKGAVAGKSPPVWERDWFHKEVLSSYCHLFSFEQQSLLDGLRMFLAAFRLPGEAQQIDRILQAFSDSCGQVCEESANGRLKLFSVDPKRASDAAYLLSFSIIMLNTDRHNANIREDRKMSCADFIKNNTDYGRDITEKGREFPPEYLTGIYNSINEEQIRTEEEGADGAMTVERWKDVLRSAAVTPKKEAYDGDFLNASVHDAEDLTELVLEHVWKPIMSSIGALWGVIHHTAQETEYQTYSKESSSGHNSMLGVQGARLGMDMALDMLEGVRQLGRVDIFRKIFMWVCDYSGLMGHYEVDAVERTWTLTESVEAQSAVVVALRTAAEQGEYLDEEGWKRVWAILFELRDLKLLPRGKSASGLVRESDLDFLTESARRDWTMCLIKGDMDFASSQSLYKPKSSAVGSVLGVFGRALFGSDASSNSESTRYDTRGDARVTDRDANSFHRSIHGKEDLVIWNDGAPSDNDDDEDDIDQEAKDASESPSEGATQFDHLSPGAQFENQLIRESIHLSEQMDMPVTGLERVEDTRRYQSSPRARVRERFRACVSVEAVVGDSRFMAETGLHCLLRSLVSSITAASRPLPKPMEMAPTKSSGTSDLERTSSFSSTSSTSLIGGGSSLDFPISPASEAFAEVLICEVALRNKDRLKFLWPAMLQDHYIGRLTSILGGKPGDNNNKVPQKLAVDPGLEKRIVGLLRLSVCGVKREDVASDILSSWRYVLPQSPEAIAASPLRALDRHMSEGLWRIVAEGDALLNLNDEGWEGLVSLFNWCVMRGASLPPVHPMEGREGLADDDPAFQSYRALHLLLNTSEVDEKVPPLVIGTLWYMCAAGESRRHPQLSIAALDLMNLLLEKNLVVFAKTEQLLHDKEAADLFWSNSWRKIVEGLAEAAEKSSHSSVRQHALSGLTDVFLDKRGSLVPSEHLCAALSEVCAPLAGRCIVGLQMGKKFAASSDELLIEFELCIGLLFKPLRHHLDTIMDAGGNSLSSLWMAVLSVLEEILKKRTDKKSDSEAAGAISEDMKATMNNLANEHFQNAILGLISANVLLGVSKSPGDIAASTWEAIGRMNIEEATVKEWKQKATK